MKIDGVVNINTLITAATLLVSGALAYATLDKRISLLEQQTVLAVQAATDRAAETKDTLREVRVDIKELARIINEDIRPKKEHK